MVERHVANVNVVGSNLIARFFSKDRLVPTIVDTRRLSSPTIPTLKRYAPSPRIPIRGAVPPIRAILAIQRLHWTTFRPKIGHHSVNEVPKLVPEMCVLRRSFDVIFAGAERRQRVYRTGYIEQDWVGVIIHGQIDPAVTHSRHGGSWMHTGG